MGIGDLNNIIYVYKYTYTYTHTYIYTSNSVIIKIKILFQLYRKIYKKRALKKYS